MDLLFRCSSLGKLMTEPVSIAPELITPEVAEIQAKKKRTDEEKAILADLKARTLSETAKTHVRELAAQAIFGVDFEFSSKQTEKGIQCEPVSIALLNSVRGLALTKNSERRDNGLITGECDLFDATRRRGHDIKTSWSIATFPIVVADCEDKLYEWQMRGYMALWDADEWEVNYCLVSTPDSLLAYEPQHLHFVEHIPAHHRVTTWLVKRDAEKEALIERKVRMARDYYAQVIAEFDRAHPQTIADAVELLAASEPELAPAEQAPEAAPAPTPVLALALASAPAPAPVAADNVVSITTKTPPQAAAPTLRLGQINERLSPVSVDAFGLSELGFPPAAQQGAAKLYHERDFHAICAAIAQHAVAVANGQKAA